MQSEQGRSQAEEEREGLEQGRQQKRIRVLKLEAFDHLRGVTCSMNASLNARLRAALLLCALLFALEMANSRAADKAQTNPMQLASTAFAEGEPIPARH